MMKYGKGIVVLLVIMVYSYLYLPASTPAEASKYGIMVSDGNLSLKLYDNLTVLSPKNTIMVKTELVCKELGLAYQYDNKTKKLIIKNNENDKSLEFTLDSKDFIYYSGKDAEGAKKTASYQCYYDKKSKSYLISAATLDYMIEYSYHKTSVYDKYATQGYKGFVIYNASQQSEKDADDYVAIEDPVLEGAIRNSIDKSKGRITYGDMSKLKKLTLWDSIASLKGLEAAVNLEYFEMHDQDMNDYFDYWVIGGLTNLKELYLDSVPFNDLLILKNLKKLKTLSIETLRIKTKYKHTYNYFASPVLDITAMKYLTNIENIILYEVKISDFDSMNNLKKLKSLEMSEFDDNDVDLDLSKLNNPYLSALTITYKNIRLEDLKNLKGLEYLVLSFVNIDDISYLLHLKNLKYVRIGFDKLNSKTPEVVRELNKFAYVELDKEYMPVKKVINSKEAPMSGLTTEIEDRLRSYPYYREPNIYGVSVILESHMNYDFYEIQQEKPDLAKWIYDYLFEVVDLKNKAKFFTKETLTYEVDNHYVIRGVLQEDNEDGTYSEQDVEVIFEQNLEVFYEVKIRYLGDQIVIKGQKTSNSSTVIKKRSPITKLTSDVIQRLQDYDYYFGPYSGFEAIEPKRTVTDDYIYREFLDLIKPDDNEKIFTSPELTYQPHYLYYAIRFVLQTKLSDGSIKEQDMECVIGQYNPKITELGAEVIFNK